MSFAARAFGKSSQKKGRANEIVASALGRFSNLDPEESFFPALFTARRARLTGGQGPSGHYYPAVSVLVLYPVYLSMELLVST